MDKALAFFPWIYLDEPAEIGPLRLIPWVRGRAPRDLPEAKMADIDGVLSAYANRPGQPLSKATLLEYGDWHLGTDAAEVVSTLFKVRELVGFSALSARKLFSQSFDYCSYDSYSLVVQRYQRESPGTFVFTSRRRDGGTNQFWSSDEYAFHRPHHVSDRTRFGASTRLLNALVPPDKVPDYILAAISEFNLANTDSPDVPEHVEIIMMKSAFEWLFQINERADEFCRNVKSIVKGPKDPSALDTPHASEWLRKRPGSSRLIECWAKEFCDIRGVAAHGAIKRGAERFVWPEFHHLAFASVLFPLVVYQRLAELGVLEADDYDDERLANIELYLATDPRPSPGRKYSPTHPWQDVESEALLDHHARRIYNSTNPKLGE